MIGLKIRPTASGSPAADDSSRPLGVEKPVRKAYSCFQARIQLASKITSPSIISPVTGFDRRQDMA